MNLLSPDFESRLRAAVSAIAADDAFAAEVTAEVDAFFKRNPGLNRTCGAELIAAVTIFERLSAASSKAEDPQK